MPASNWSSPGDTIGTIGFSSGTAAAPGFYSISFPTTGFYMVTTNVLGISTAGVGAWKWDASGNYMTVTDGGVDLGASGATRPNTVYVKAQVIIGDTAATAGQVRLNNTGGINWRNNANGANISLAKDTSDVLIYGGVFSATSGLKTKVSTANVSTPPTQAELVTAFGAAATTGAGFVALVNDNAGGAFTYIIWSDGTNYFYILGTVGA